MQKLNVYETGKGFRQIDDFIWSSLLNDGESDEDVFNRLGYERLEQLYSNTGYNWVEVFSNDKSDYRFIVGLCNPCTTEYILCSNYIDYLDFMKQYLPVIKQLNEAAEDTYKKDITDD
jgi:hypothetical protein